MSHDIDEDELNIAAIVCEHVATKRAAILRADRSEPEDDDDSGWQFLCGNEDENWERAQVWALGEVLSLDPSLLEHVQMPAGTVLTRLDATASWQLEESE